MLAVLVKKDVFGGWGEKDPDPNPKFLDMKTQELHEPDHTYGFTYVTSNVYPRGHGSEVLLVTKARSGLTHASDKK